MTMKSCQELVKELEVKVDSIAKENQILIDIIERLEKDVEVLLADIKKNVITTD